MPTKSREREMENHEYWQGVSSKSLAIGKASEPNSRLHREQRVEEKRKIAEFA